jgi:hypothetical protein
MYAEKNPPSIAVDTNSAEAPASPTGIPALPPKVVPWIVGVVGAAMLCAKTLPPHTVAAQVCSGLVDVAVLLGLASPGWRK